MYGIKKPRRKKGVKMPAPRSTSTSGKFDSLRYPRAMRDGGKVAHEDEAQDRVLINQVVEKKLKARGLKKGGKVKC